MMKWARRIAYAALAFSIAVFMLDVLTRHFFLLVSDTLSIVAIAAVIWALHKIKS